MNLKLVSYLREMQTTFERRIRTLHRKAIVITSKFCLSLIKDEQSKSLNKIQEVIFMKQKVKKIVTMALTGALVCATFTPTVAYAAPVTSSDKVIASIKDILEDTLKREGVTQTEWNDYIDFVKDGSAQGAQERGVAGAVKKAIKFVVKHLDVIPSKALREAIEKYGGKVIDVIDTIDTWTWYGIATALTAVGAPDSAADLIADFIVDYLL